jgi:hypothetical protein
MAEPTKPMRTEAANTGFYNSLLGKRYPRLQILTVGKVLGGKEIDYPPLWAFSVLMAGIYSKKST